MLKRLLALVLSFSGFSSISCGGDYFFSNEFYSLFNQELAKDTSLFSLLYEPDNRFYYSEAFENYEQRLGDPNLKEWRSYLGEDVQINDLYNMVYHFPYQKICPVYQTVLNRKRRIPDSLKENSIVRMWARGEHTALADYLIFAKRCEKQALIGEDYWSQTTRDYSLMEALLNEGLLLYGEQKDDFMKLRYGYQLVRLANYSGKNEEAVRLFDSLVEPIALKNYIYYRTLEQKAGALSDMDDPEATYLFARLFNILPDRKEVCLISFSISRGADWEEVFSKAQDPDEQAALYVMRSLANSGVEVEEMENIYRDAPHSNYLDILLMRNLARLEPFFLHGPEPFSWYGSEEESLREEAERLKILVQTIGNNPNSKEPQLYKLAEAHIAFMLGDYKHSGELLAKTDFNEKYTAQVNTIKFLNKLSLLQELNPTLENALEEEFQKGNFFNKATLRSFMMDKCAAIYFKQGEMGKSFLCHNKLSDLRYDVNLKLLRDLEKFYFKEDKSGLEKFLAGNKEIELISLYLNEFAGIWYLQHNQLDSALLEFNEMKKYNQAPGFYLKVKPELFAGIIGYAYKYKPFAPQSDSMHLQYSFLKPEYDPITLIHEFKNLEKLAIDQPDKAHLYYLMLANAWNNMSPEGYYREVLRPYDWGGYNAYKERREEQNFLYYGKRFTYYYDQDIALGYALKAMAAAKDPDQKAKAVFAAAKAEQMSYYNKYSGDDYWKREGIPDQYHTYYHMLENEYSNTEYYKQILRECGHFDDYTKN